VGFTQRIISVLLTVIWPFASLVDSLSLERDWDVILAFRFFWILYIPFFVLLVSVLGEKIWWPSPSTLVFPQGFPNVVT